MLLQRLLRAQRGFFRNPLSLVMGAISLLSLASSGVAGERVDYLKEIKPLLREKCSACHGALKQNAKLRLDTAALARKGGRGGPAVEPGNEKSLLLERISARDEAERMPPEGPPLSPEQIAKLRAWIVQGAISPLEERPESDPREHWAFRFPKRPAVPAVKDTAWSKNPIDTFLAAEHEKQGLAPRPPAEKSLLLRRVYLDLIGLPPTPTELKAFLEDKAPDAWEKVVDRLLADPRYGERWGRHWMDVWRYSDWYGRRMVPDVWNSAPQIWRWRDWIVRSLNQDKGYDRMVMEMLAADEICPDDDEAAVATGFLVRNWYALNPNDWMRSNVEHVGKAFLGLTFNCAHCHDHKYDPIAHEDYFRFRAFFEPIGIRQDRVPGEADPGPFQEYDYSVLRKVVRLGTVRIFDKNPKAPTWFYTGGDERNRLKEKGEIPPGVPAIFGSGPEIKPVELPPAAFYPGLRPGIRATLLKEQRDALAKAEARLASFRMGSETTLSLLQEKLLQAEADLRAVAMTAEDAGRPLALSGKQSLILNAGTGRRIVQNGLQGLKKLDDGSTLRFELLLLKDAHFNLQLAKDQFKGLTAGYVAFEKGRISSYRPGSFTEFEVGRYDFSGGQDRFEVSLVLQTKMDRCLLTIRARKGDQVLVDKVPVSLNGWNPVGDPNKAITFDARTGSVVAIDDVTLEAVGGTRMMAFDFERPIYPEGRDVVGTDGWSASSFCVEPGTSLVAMTAPSPALRAASEKVRLARRAVEAIELNRKRAQADVAASQAGLASIEARIAADQARFGKMVDPALLKLSGTAAQTEREAALKRGEADVLARDAALAAAEVKPISDPARVKEIEVASKALTAAQVQLEKARAVLKTPPKDYTPLGPLYPKTSTGRRKALAEWIAGPSNPLTARVAVNHVWMRHFHAPLVSSVFDFGRSGAKPAHPELLDWLAVELMESGWSTKKLHRLIVTSQAYRMTSSEGKASDNAKRDPENQFLWRMNVGRMEAEVVRDSLLYVGGRLDLTMGGQELENSQALTTHRRSLYYSCNPEADGKSELGALFDAPEAGECYRRSRTVIPQQALALTNSDLVHEISGKLAQKLWAGLSPEEQKVPAAFVNASFECVLARRPGSAELEACVDFLAQAERRGKTLDTTARARESLVRSLLNHNDFLTIR